MREAEAAIAESENVRKQRKDALIAFHVDGRESHDLDYIFDRPLTDVLNKQPNSDNFLDAHNKKVIEEVKQERSTFFNWGNLRTEDTHQRGSQASDHFLNLDIGTESGSKGPRNDKPESRGVVEAVNTNYNATTEGRPPRREEIDLDDDEDEIKRERERMLSLIKKG